MSSKSESKILSGREDDFFFLREQFEARIQSLKLVLTDDDTYEDYMPNVRNSASEEQRTQAVKKQGKN